MLQKWGPKKNRKQKRGAVKYKNGIRKFKSIQVGYFRILFKGNAKLPDEDQIKWLMEKILKV